VNFEVIEMRRFFSCVIFFAAGLGAQPPDFPQPPPAPAGPQAYEFHTGVLTGGSYLGVNLAEIDSTRAKELKLKETTGVEITRVEEGSPAEKAGLKPNDVVLEYNGQRVEGMEQFGRLVRETPGGREVKLVISRNGATQTITATVAARKVRAFGGNIKDFLPDMPEIRMPDMPQMFSVWRSPVLGVEAEALGSQLAAYFGVKDGVLVRSVLKDSAAEKAGVKAGDVITKVDGVAVTTPNELSNAAHSAGSKGTFALELMRDHKVMSLSVAVDDGRSERAVPRTRVVRNDLN
jgi:serine protease Do